MLKLRAPKFGKLAHRSQAAWARKLAKLVWMESSAAEAVIRSVRNRLPREMPVTTPDADGQGFRDAAEKGRLRMIQDAAGNLSNFVRGTGYGV